MNCCQFFHSRDLQTLGNTYAEVLKEVLGLGIDIELAALGVLGEVESGDLGNVLILALTLLLLKLEGDTADGATLNALHQMGGVAGNLVAEALGGNDGDLIADTFSSESVGSPLCSKSRLEKNIPLVGLEVESQLGVVPLNDDLGGLLDSLGTNATHFDGLVWWLVVGEGKKGPTEGDAWSFGHRREEARGFSQSSSPNLWWFFRVGLQLWELRALRACQSFGVWLVS